MTFLMTRIQVDDYDKWKAMFDTDPPGARKQAKGHRIYRDAEEPNEVLVQVEFGSADDARAARELLRSSGVLERVTLKAGPAIAEQAEIVAY